ncbi:MAG: hypothetical protein CYG60_23770 [Actinobacteria bacterium]|nr:MAG: hypothetical protein CYG60_23770 [Actinomycetota bacterium]
MDEDKQEEGLPSWVGTERGQLFTSGLLAYDLERLIPLWLDELPREMFTKGKDGYAASVPPNPDTVALDVGGGQTVWFQPDAYPDADGYLRTEVRDRPARTDLALLGALAALEGGEPDPKLLRTHYERMWMGRKRDKDGKFVHVPTESEKALLLAKALLQYRDPEAFAKLSERERRERVVGIAERIGSVVKALVHLAMDLETGTVRPPVKNVQRDVRAAELRDKGWTWVDIGDYLGIPQTEKDKIKNQNDSARKAGERGERWMKRVRTLLGLPSNAST